MNAYLSSRRARIPNDPDQRDVADWYELAFNSIVASCFEAETPDEAVDAKLDAFHLFDIGFQAAESDLERILFCQQTIERFEEI
jgi:hypothetical protein